MTDAYSMIANVQLYRGLFKYTSNGEVEPDLVESWTTTPDHLEYRFKLKHRTFSNGVEISTEHVRQTFARMFHIGAAMAADLSYISGAKRFRTSHKLSDLRIDVISPKEMVIHLHTSSPLFLKHLAAADCGLWRSKTTAQPFLPIQSQVGPISYNPGIIQKSYSL